MNKLACLISFVAGGVVGFSGAFYYLNQKFQKDLEKEVQGFKDIIEEKAKEEPIQELEPQEKEENQNELPNSDLEPDTSNYVTKEDLEKYEGLRVNYTSYAPESSGKPVEKPKLQLDPIRVIREEDFGKDPEYDEVSLTWYQDGIVEDEDGELLDFPEGEIGTEAVKLLSDEEQDVDVVYVQNEKTKMYYEIMVDGDVYPDAY